MLFYTDAPIMKFIWLFQDPTKTNEVMAILLDTITEIAVPIAAILLIIWLIRHWKR